MKNKGFTLIELLVVISIIGILATVIIASLGQARTRAKDAAVMAALSSYRTEIELEYPNADYTDLCTSDLYTEMSAYVAEKGGSLDVCDADATDYILIATLPSGNQASTLFNADTAFAQQQEMPSFSGNNLFCINAKGTAVKITAAEFQNMLTYASGLTDSGFNTNIISPYCSLTELQVDLGIIEEGEVALNIDSYFMVCPAMTAAVGLPAELTTTGCVGMDSAYQFELIDNGVDPMTAGIQSMQLANASFCANNEPDPMYLQYCGGGGSGELNFDQYQLVCPAMSAVGIPSTALESGCMGMDTAHMQELLQEGVDQMTAAIQSIGAVNPSFCSGVVPGPEYTQFCSEEPEYEYTRSCNLAEAGFLPPNLLATGCVGLNGLGAMTTMQVLMMQYEQEYGSMPEEGSPEFMNIFAQAFAQNAIAADPGMCSGEPAC
jgi:prepilin-type N-terminal cleavage/methylation domain-containing protein